MNYFKCTFNSNVSYTAIYWLTNLYYFQVNTTLLMMTIKEYDEVTGVLSVVGSILTDWFDHRLTWTPADYGGVSYVIVPPRFVWRPCLVLANPANALKQIGTDVATVRVHSDGTMQWKPGDIMKTICPADVTYYPFDVQICQIKISAYGLYHYEINFHSDMDEIFRPTFTEHGEWELMSTKAEALVENSISRCYFTLHLYRRSTYFVVNLLWPVIFLGLLNNMVFLIPPGSGERISYSVTVLLAIIVFLSSLADSLPKTSLPMSLLSYYLLANTALSVYICLSSILIVRSSHRTDSIPGFLVAIAQFKCKRPIMLIASTHPDTDNGVPTSSKQMIYISTKLEGCW
jgi:nicotinic acetylcholine receptor